jgi:hypothetical protein
VSFIERYLIIGILITTITGGFYAYVSWQSSKIEDLTADNATLKSVSESNAAALKVVQNQIQKQVAENIRLSSALNRSEETREEMLKIFRKHNLTKLATQKPGLIERRINDGTRKAFDDLESITAN